MKRKGFDPVDARPLRIARYTGPFALVIGKLAYAGTVGPELAYGGTKPERHRSDGDDRYRQ